jgi:RimJ/RimL family protein N-acetyltransferase
MKFETEKVFVKLIDDIAVISDEKIVEIFSDKVTEYLPVDWKGISQRKRPVQWIQDKMKDGMLCSIKLKHSRELIGFLFLYGVDSQVQSRDVRIGYVISEKYWGKGIVSKVIHALVEFFCEKGNVSSIIAGVEPGNLASIKVLTKNGFVFSDSKNNVMFYSYSFE